MKNLLSEVKYYSWSQLYKCYNREVELDDLETIHFEIEQMLVDSKKLGTDIYYIRYFQDRIRFYYIEDKEEQFLELSLFGFSKEVQEPLYDSCSGIWRHSDNCFWY